MAHKRVYVFASVTALVLAALACNLPGGMAPTPAAPVTPDMTRVALEYQSTQMALQLTQAAAQPVQPAQPPVQPTQPPAATEPQPTPTQDLTARMKQAKILVYEDTQGIGLWVSDALNGMGLKYTFVGDRIGDLMSNLNSGINWDLIIIAAESKSRVQGEFWDVISEKVVNNQSGLIAEVWYLDQIGNGRIKSITTGCGVTFQRDWPLAESVYWLTPDDPVFNVPNTAMPLIHYNRYWNWQAGDLIKLSPGSNAALLAGIFQKQKSDYGVLASCYNGRVIFQTFSNHDYRYSEIISLWQNYITNVLTNRFAVVP